MADDTHGLIFALQLDGMGGAEELDWHRCLDLWPSATQSAPGLWLHLDRRGGPQVDEWLEGPASLPVTVSNALLADATRPRCQAFANGILLVLRGVNLNPESDPDDMVSLRVWMEPGRLISVRLRRLLAVQDLRDTLIQGQGPTDVGALIVALIARLTERMDPILDQLEDDMDSAEDLLEDQADRAAEQSLRFSLQEIRQSAIRLRRYIAPQRDAVATLSTMTHTALGGIDREALREAVDHVTRYVETLDSLRERAMVVQDELSNRQNERLNQRMYILTLAAGLFLPLSFLTGLLGVNVGGVPWASEPWGFALVSLGMIALGIGEVLLFRRLRWF